MSPHYPGMGQNPYVTSGVQSTVSHLGFTRPSHAIKENWNPLESPARIEGDMLQGKDRRRKHLNDITVCAA
jgi:hypothetical protein